MYILGWQNTGGNLSFQNISNVQINRYRNNMVPTGSVSRNIIRNSIINYMGLLDPKETVLDVILTDYGRELLAQNRLNFTYYAFSDEGIDYSGSISTKNFTGSIDDVIFRNFSFEENQRKGKTNSDLKYFLYTIPAKSLQIPDFVINPTTGSTVTLNRNYYKENFSTQNSNFNFYARPLDVVFRATIPTENREAQYVKFQNYVKILSSTYRIGE